MTEARTDPHQDTQETGGIDWAGFHQRLEASRAALAQKLNPSREEKQRTLRARARLLATHKREKAPLKSMDVVEFLLASEHYGIELSYIREIHPLSEFTALPCTPPFVLGLANVRGQVLSIIDIKKLFDLPEKGLTDLNKVIIVQANQMEVGILADAILGVRSIALHELHTSLPTLTGIREEYLKGITKDPLVVLDAGKILSDEKIIVDESRNWTT
jgi:purine-binding chemotaxis protein CheW